MEGIELLTVIVAFVSSVAPLYYKIGKLEIKVKQLSELIELKARWKK